MNHLYHTEIEHIFFVFIVIMDFLLLKDFLQLFLFVGKTIDKFVNVKINNIEVLTHFKWKKNQFYGRDNNFQGFSLLILWKFFKKKNKNRRKVIVKSYFRFVIFSYTIVSCKKNVTRIFTKWRKKQTENFKLKKTYSCFFFKLVYLCGDIISAFPRYVEVATSDSHNNI